jgi:hypothetical protein
MSLEIKTIIPSFYFSFQWHICNKNRVFVCVNESGWDSLTSNSICCRLQFHCNRICIFSQIQKWKENFWCIWMNKPTAFSCKKDQWQRTSLKFFVLSLVSVYMNAKQFCFKVLHCYLGTYVSIVKTYYGSGLN